MHNRKSRIAPSAAGTPEHAAAAPRDRPADQLPLYVQVRSELLQRIADGVWKPGDLLPSEFALAGELGVSQGTVRKALDSLGSDKLVTRRQGRGTFVTDQTPADLLFRFFKIYTRTGERVQPTSRDVRVRRRPGTRRECISLRIDAGSEVIRITRTRLNGTTPIIRETIVLPAATFPGLDETGTVPNTLYDLFQHRYGITVLHADERIESVAAGTRDAGYLNVEAGTPLMKIDRFTYGLGDRIIEWRISLCHLKGLHYLAELR